MLLKFEYSNLDSKISKQNKLKERRKGKVVVIVMCSTFLRVSGKWPSTRENNVTSMAYKLFGFFNAQTSQCQFSPHSNDVSGSFHTNSMIFFYVQNTSALSRLPYLIFGSSYYKFQIIIYLYIIMYIVPNQDVNSRVTVMHLLIVRGWEVLTCH